jgi:hypothetical protein
MQKISETIFWIHTLDKINSREALVILALVDDHNHGYPPIFNYEKAVWMKYLDINTD